MRHVARLPREDVNVTPRDPLKEAGLLLTGALAVVVLLLSLGALLVDRIVVHVPASWEARLFPDFARLGEPPETAEERDRQRELEELLSRLLLRWPDSPDGMETLRIGVLDEETPNALALPGGLVLVTVGLLDAVGSENELAFVLGHEIGHFRGRDQLRSLGRRLTLVLALTALGQRGSLSDLLALSGELAERRFSRDQEEEADAFALFLVASEYGHVGGATDFFQRLPAPDGALAQSLGNYLSTHPLSEERVAEMKRLAREKGWPKESPRPHSFDIEAR